MPVPLSADSILQENAGGADTGAGATFTVTLPSATTAGSTVVLIVSSLMASMPANTGWTLDASINPGGSGLLCALHLSNVAAGVTSWTLTASTANNPLAWYVAEVGGLDADTPLDVWASNGSGWATVTAPNTVSVSTGATAAGVGMDSLVFAAWAASATAGKTTGTFGSYTHDLVEGGQATAPNAAEVSWRLAVAHRLSGGANAGPFSDTATYTQSDGTSTGNAVFAGIFAFRAADSPIGFPVGWMTGFEQGSHNGLGSTTTIGKPLWSTVTGTVGTDIIVGSAYARPGGSGSGCRIVQSASAKSLLATGTVLPIGTGIGARIAVVGFPVKVVSGSGVVVLAGLESQSASLVPFPQVVYDTSTSKVGVRVGTSGTPGTPAYQSGTTAAGTWVWVDLRVRGTTASNVGTTHADWALDGVTQTSPADVTVTGATYNFTAARWGSSTTQTVTFDVDDLVYSTQGPAFPLGQHSIRALTVDPAGTPTVNGTVGNFALMTANATGAALTTGTLVDARNALDDLPPVISTASDGVLQTATAATNYVEFPMSDLPLGAEVIAAVKALAVLASTTGAGAGTLSVKGWDGVTEHNTIVPSAAMTPGSSTAVSATVPPYASGMWPNTWTPAKLAAAALRVGYSDDATPDMGVHAIYLEVAARAAITAKQIDVEDGTFTVDVALSPYSSASVSYVATSNHPTRGATFTYSINGTPQVPEYVEPNAATTVTVDAESFGDISDVTLTPDPAA